MMQQFLRAFAALAVAGALFGQSASTKQPKPKSQKEVDAFNAMLGAADDDARIAAAEALVTKFADSDFKPLALYIATAAAQSKGDFEKLVIYGERTLEADPKMYGVMLMMASGYASKTKEFDFDKEEKLGKAEKYATDGIALAKTAGKPNPGMSDEQWEAARKDFMAQGHEALGMSATVRKKYDVAAAEYKEALAVAPKPDPTTMLRLASVLNLQSKWDEALPLLEQVKDHPDAVPVVKQAAAQERVKALMGQKKAAAPPPPPAAPKQ
jgi:tetratricopeptide (TPR) repeat protein